MLDAILWALILTACTAGMHILGSIVLIGYLRKFHHHLKHSHIYIFLLTRVVTLLLVLHGLEAILWACFYEFKGALPDFETSLYFSLTSYSTIGYGDVVLPEGLRLIGVWEGLVGTFMCGWSVALLVALIHAAVTKPADLLLQERASQ